VESYRSNAMNELAGFQVIKSKDFSNEGYVDEDEENLPLQNFIQLQLENGFTISIRPSGTEPKIKYYLFGCSEPNPVDLLQAKEQVTSTIEKIQEWLVEDAQSRVK